jgi:tyrosyl-tRNA synthetase
MIGSKQIEEKIKLITRNTEEVLTIEDLRNLIAFGTKLRHYIGFEISGKVHLGQGLVCMGKVADFLKAGADCHIFLADWHTYINEKLGGDWKNIKKVALGYFKEALIAGLKCFGVSSGEVNFVLASELYKDPRHWQNLMEVSRHVTLSRVKRSITITGKKEGDKVTFAQLIYPPLQVADIFTLGVNIAHAGIDQRKAHVIARQVAKKLKISPLLDKDGRKIAPIAVHNNFILGLGKPSINFADSREMEKDVFATEFKMSKSKPDWAIFIHDSPEEIKRKVAKAFCPPGQVEFNPIVNWVQFLVFWGEEEGEFKVKRPAKFGGDKTYYNLSDLIREYQEKALHPQDLKNALAEWLIRKLEPARKHFHNPKRAEALRFLEKII